MIPDKATLSYRLKNSIKSPKSWMFYLVMGLAINQIIWGATLIFLKVNSPAYTSKWAIAVNGVKSSTNVSLPGIGEASSSSDSPYNSQTSDVRENYKYIAESDEVIEMAAKQLDIPKKKFGKPKAKILDNSTLMEFEIKGNNPKDAQTKAIALQSALSVRLDELRRQEVTRQAKNMETGISPVKEKLQIAQQQLSNYKALSPLSSNEQLQDLTTNLEGLRRQQAETVAQLQQATARVRQLTADLGLSTPQAVDALILQSDSLFQQYLADYTKASAELVKLRTKYLPGTPVVVSKQQEKDAAEVALLQRGQSLLKRPVSQDTLKQLTLSGGGSSGSPVQRANLFQELVSLREQQQGLQAQAQELDRQIAKLESRLVSLSQQESKLDTLQRDVKIAEAVFSSNLTKQELSKSDISAAYPPASLVTRPSLPEEPVLKKNFVLLGAGMSSLFFTTGTTLLWLRDRKLEKNKQIIRQRRFQKTEEVS
jgi:uncharacterized protein involved in exopolysaccharide biosynthesis